MPTKILMLGDSITAGVWGAMIGAGQPRVAPADWEFTIRWDICDLIQATQVKSNTLYGEGKRYDVVVVSSGVGNAIAEVENVLFEGQPAGLDTLLPTTLAIADLWKSVGATVVLTAGPGLRPTFAVEDAPPPATPMTWLNSIQGMYQSHWQDLLASNHRPIVRYWLPQREPSYWLPYPASNDTVHMAVPGLQAMAKKLKKRIELELGA